MKTFYIFLITVLLVGCGPSAGQMTATADIALVKTQTAAPPLTPSYIPTITPTSTPFLTPTPEFTNIYESKSLGVSIRYPTGWTVNESSDSGLTQITIEKENKKINLYFYPAEAQQQNNNNPLSGLNSFIQFVGYSMPDKETPHLINLNGSEFAFGSYSKPGDASGLGPADPYFVAMHFTEKYTIAIEFLAPPGEEQENRKIFELILTSLPPSPPRTVIATPTLKPNVKTNLPKLPEGFNWQGVENIDLALPVPEGWFVKFIKQTETWQNGLQEYNYQYYITQEDPNLVGAFSPTIGTMQVVVRKKNNINVSDNAKNLYTELKNNLNVTRVIEDQVNEQGNVISYKYYVERKNSDVAPSEPGYNQTFYTTIIANRKTKTTYIFAFYSSTDLWDKEWKTGQVMMNAMYELLQQ